MADPPFGFGLPGGSGSSGGRGGSGGSGGGPGGGPLGDPQQFADALRQFADLMAWQGGAVNWDLAKNVARQTVAAEGDPSVLDADRKKVVEAIQLADLWLNEVTSFPSGVRTAQAWSRSEWVEATLPVWSTLCDPIAEKAVDALGGMINANPEELGGELPPELSSALQGLGGLGGMAGLTGGLGQMMRRIGGMMVGGQTGGAGGGVGRAAGGGGGGGRARGGVPPPPGGGAAAGPGGRSRAAARRGGRLQPGPVGQRRGDPDLPRVARGRPPPAVRARPVAALATARRGRGLRARDHGGR